MVHRQRVPDRAQPYAVHELKQGHEDHDFDDARRVVAEELGEHPVKDGKQHLLENEPDPRVVADRKFKLRFPWVR